MPLKATDETSWIGPLERFIKANYGNLEDYQSVGEMRLIVQDIAILQGLRDDMRGAGRDITGRDIMYRYGGLYL